MGEGSPEKLGLTVGVHRGLGEREKKTLLPQRAVLGEVSMWIDNGGVIVCKCVGHCPTARALNDIYSCHLLPRFSSAVT